MISRQEGFFKSKDGLELFFESTVPEAPLAHVGLLHGYADHCARYRKTIDYLASQNLALHAYDFRGHGKSKGRRGHCDAFAQYLDDLDLFWERVRAAAGGKKCFLLAHSHGALTSLDWWMTRSPRGLAGWVLTSPWLRLGYKAPSLKVLLAQIGTKLIPWLPVSHGLVPEDASRDPEVPRSIRADSLFNRRATPRWYMQALSAQARVLAGAAQVNVPTLMLCGSADRVASVPTAREFFQALGSLDKQYREFPGMRHEVWNEQGKEQVWDEIAGWIKSRL